MTYLFNSSGRLIRAPQVLTSGTSYSKPDGCKAIIVELVGGGGGGGGTTSAASNAAGGAGGAAGAYARKFFDVSALAGPFTYALGTAGSAGNDTGGNGGNGGSSTFSDGTTTVTAPGGTGGSGMTAGTGVAINAGGITSIATNGDLNAGGAPGGHSVRLSGTVCHAGNGGSGPFGAGGRGLNVGGSGIDGRGFGAGGSGGNVTNGSGAVTGGAGTAGVIVVWEYY